MPPRPKFKRLASLPVVLKDRKQVATRPVMLLVLGPHRSGTSLTTRMLECLGAENSSQQMWTGSDNPKGFFEDAAVYSFNETVLLPHLQQTWSTVSLPDWSEISKAERGRLGLQALAILRKNYSASSPLSILKEPRINNTLPFWVSLLEHAGFDVRFVCTVRDPVSAARSLSQRNGFTLAHGSMIYLSAWLAVLPHLQERQVAFVQFDEIFASPAKVLTTIAQKLGLPLPTDFDQRVHQFSSEHLDPSLRHSSLPREDVMLEPDLPPLVAELYRALLDAAQSQNTRKTAKFVAYAERQIENLAPLLADYDAKQSKLSSLKTEYDNAQTECAHLRSQLTDSTQQSQTAVVAERDAVTAERDALAARVSSLESAHSSLSTLHSSLVAERDDLATRHHLLATELEALRPERSDLVTRHTSLVTALEDLQGHHSSLVTESEALRSDHSSLSTLHSSLIAERDGLIAERDALVTEREALQSAHSSLSTLYSSLIAERDSLVQERDQIRSERDTLAQERDQIVAERSDLVTRHSSLATALEELQGHHSSLSTLHSSLVAERDDLATRLSAFESEHSELATRNQQLATALESLQSQHSSLSTLHTSLGTSLEELQGHHSSLSVLHSSLVAERDDLATRHSSLVTSHNDLVTRHTSLVTCHNDLVTRHSSLATEHEALHSDHSALVTRHTSLVTSSNDLTARLSSLQDERATLSAATAAEREAKSKVEAQLNDVTEENELLLAQLHQVQEELEKYFLENRELKQSSEQQTARLHKEAEGLQERLTNAEEKRIKLAAERDECTNWANDLRSKLEKARALVEERTNWAKNLEAELQSARVDKKALEDKVSSHFHELAILARAIAESDEELQRAKEDAVYRGANGCCIEKVSLADAQEDPPHNHLNITLHNLQVGDSRWDRHHVRLIEHHRRPGLAIFEPPNGSLPLKKWERSGEENSVPYMLLVPGDINGERLLNQASGADFCFLQFLVGALETELNESASSKGLPAVRRAILQAWLPRARSLRRMIDEAGGSFLRYGEPRVQLSSQSGSVNDVHVTLPECYFAGRFLPVIAFTWKSDTDVLLFSAKENPVPPFVGSDSVRNSSLGSTIEARFQSARKNAPPHHDLSTSEHDAQLAKAIGEKLPQVLESLPPSFQRRARALTRSFLGETTVTFHRQEK